MSVSVLSMPSAHGYPLLDASAQYGSVNLVEQLAGDWRKLCEDVAGNEPFYRPEWIAAYLRAFAPEALILLLTVHAGSQLRAVLPLVRSSGLFCGIPARILRSPSNVHSCRFDLVCGNNDTDAAIACIWDRLKSVTGWDVVCLEDVPAGGRGERLLAVAASEGWPTGQWETVRSPFVPLAGVTDPVALAANSHFRQNLRRRLRKASERWSIELHRCQHADPASLNEFYALENSGWKGRKRTAIDSLPAIRQFYDEVANAAAAFGYFCLYLLRFEQVPVAGHFGLFYNQRYYTPKVAYDERFAAFGPGHLIVEAALRDCLARGVREFDFLGPSMPWKLEWTSRVRPHHLCYIFRKSSFGRMLHAAKFQLMARVRTLAGRPRLAHLRRLLAGER